VDYEYGDKRVYLQILKYLSEENDRDIFFLLVIFNIFIWWAKFIRNYACL